ncbi:MAG: D-tyrosyl-tRNA(Tyr) deacylase [Chloroflexi bacterium]|nr:D-tyrosyl-tRNA(Tyr) deacylase [Chloroflexota bacterium]
MRAVIQRVKEAKVSVEGELVGEIGPGLLILLGAGKGDTPREAEWMAEKVANLRIFPDTQGKFNHSLLESGGQALVVSQFTLYADIKKGRRPSFIQAAPPEVAEPLVEQFASGLARLGIKVASGKFGAMMDVHLINDGPVTIILDSAQL